MAAILAKVKFALGCRWKTISRSSQKRQMVDGRRRKTPWVILAAVGSGIILFANLRSAQAQDPGIVATVDYAQSGHTLELLSDLSVEFPVLEVRLAGVQAPDRQQIPWGPAARECLAELASHQIRVEPQGTHPDAYGRIWANVWAKGQLVNAAVLAQGCALLDSDRLPQQRYRSELIYAQEEARLLGKGIWSPDNPLREAPSAFRQRRSAP